jgi:hypothetical protein
VTSLAAAFTLASVVSTPALASWLAGGVALIAVGVVFLGLARLFRKHAGTQIDDAKWEISKLSSALGSAGEAAPTGSAPPAAPASP